MEGSLWPIFVVGMVVGIMILLFGYFLGAEHTRLSHRNQHQSAPPPPPANREDKAYQDDLMRGERWRTRNIQDDEDYDEDSQC